MNPSLFTLLSLLAFSADAAVTYIQPSGITAEVESATVIDQRIIEIPVDEKGTQAKYLARANLSLQLVVKDAGCSLKTDSDILVHFIQDRSKASSALNHALNLFVQTASAAEVACIGGDEIVRKETVIVPLVNGIGANADQDVVHHFVLNTQTGMRIQPSAFTVTVNQAANRVSLPTLR